MHTITSYWILLIHSYDYHQNSNYTAYLYEDSILEKSSSEVLPIGVYHRDFVPDVEGCGVLMPVVFGSFTAAALGLMGVPPLTGFTSKWMLATAAAGLGTWMGYLGASVLILSAVLTALYLMQIVLLAFFPRQNRQLSVRVPKRARRDPGLRMTVPITALAAGSVALGLGAGRLAGTVVALLG